MILSLVNSSNILWRANIKLIVQRVFDNLQNENYEKQRGSAMKYMVRKEKWGYIVFNKHNREYDFFYNYEDFQKYICENKIKKSEIEYRNNLDFDRDSNTTEFLAAPLAAYLEISSNCTLKCLHCFKLKGQVYSHVLSFDKLVQIIKELYQMGVFEIRLVGYEACTFPYYTQIVDIIKELGFYIVLNTSAFYDEKKQSEIVGKDFDEYLVSLDGLRETHDRIRGCGSFDRVISFVQKINDKSKVRLNVTISSKNMNQMEELVKLADTMGVSIGFAPFRNIGSGRANNYIEMLNADDMVWIQDNVQSLRKKYFNTRIILAYHDLCNEGMYYHPFQFSKPCPSCHNISILNNGQVFHCDFLSYIGDTFCGGNVLESSLDEIWNGNYMKRYRNIEINSKCLNCKFYMKKCTGGCASEVLETQDIFYDPLCTRFPMKISYDRKKEFVYDEDYFQNGIKTQKSNYENYHWIPEYSFWQMKIIRNYLSLSNKDVLVDYGSAMGNLVRAFNESAYNMYGIDISEYAVSRVEKYRDKIFCGNSLKLIPCDAVDWVISINTLEHMSINQLLQFLKETTELKASLFYVVPVSIYDGGKYISSKSDMDISHVLRRSEIWWRNITQNFFEKVCITSATELFGKWGFGCICVRAQ